jgi:hypothetical protein
VKIVVEIDDTHMPFVRQQARLHGLTVFLDFAHFKALLPGQMVGEVVAEDCPADQMILVVEPLETE